MAVYLGSCTLLFSLLRAEQEQSPSSPVWETKAEVSGSKSRARGLWLESSEQVCKEPMLHCCLSRKEISSPASPPDNLLGLNM